MHPGQRKRTENEEACSENFVGKPQMVEMKTANKKLGISIVQAWKRNHVSGNFSRVSTQLRFPCHATYIDKNYKNKAILRKVKDGEAHLITLGTSQK
jgi:hypothetical protein